MTDQTENKTIDAHSGTETTGHSWDGIQELNTPLPRWWLYVWYMTIAGSLIYMVLMPAWPGLPGQTNTLGLLGKSDRVEVAQAVDDLKSQRADRAEELVSASLEDIRTDRDLQQFAQAMGESQFGDNCATCHGSGGQGAKGYPSLADDVWLWDGSIDGIEYTIRHGIRHSEDDATRFSAMPRFGADGLLETAQINDLAEYVLQISGQEANTEAAARGGETFAVQCAVCHGQTGTGDRSQGAPNLTDREWLYGGSRADIRNTIYNARNSHMPAWEGRLDDATIKALAFYVHSLGDDE